MYDVKGNKSQLVTEIEDHLLKGVVMPEYKQSSNLLTDIVIDVMSVLRQYGGFSTSKNFGNVVNDVLNSNQRIAQHEIIHYLFDSYKDLSIKASERKRRKGEFEAKDLAFIDEDVPIPAQIEKFWPSNINKENLQLLLRRLVRVKFEKVVLSSMVVLLYGC